MATNYTQIGATVTVGSGGTSSIDFNSIPSTYTDLVIKTSLRTNRSGFPADPINISLNGSTSNFNYRRIIGGGSGSAASDSGSTGTVTRADASTATASSFSNGEIYIPNYAGSSYKSLSGDVVTENNSTASGDAYAELYATLWTNTAAITSISLTSVTSSNFVQYSTASLYGIKKD